MPKGKSIYETYFDPGASTGKYASSLQKVSDVWANIDFSREKSAWETERRERNLDTLLAVTELGATVGGSMVGFEEGSAAISKKTGMEADSEPLKIGRGGEEWESLSGFEKLWQSPRFKFGDDTIMSKSEIRKYGRDVKEYGKYGVDLPLDVYQGKSMHAEYREGYDKEKYWHPGKYAGKALGVAEKVGQTIVPGGEVGYKDLYSGLGKKASDAVQTQEKKVEEKKVEPKIETEKKTETAVKEAGVVPFKDLLKWGKTFQSWGSGGPRSRGAITPSKAGTMGKFQEFIKSLGIDIGDTGTIKSWGPKTQDEYSKLYKQWESIGT
jgi:hypothetical protein